MRRRNRDRRQQVDREPNTARVVYIKDSEGIERALLDYKFYARSVGPVLGIEVSAGSGREELVSYTPG